MEGKWTKQTLPDDGFSNEYKDIDQTRDEVRARAEAVLCDADFAEDDEIQLDLDSDEAFVHFGQMQPWLMGELGLSPGYEVTQSRNGNRHVSFRLTGHHKMTTAERILTACLLGSDPKREALNYLRLVRTGDAKICLFRPRQKQLEAPKES